MTIMEITADDILLSGKNVALQHEPFPYFELDNFVPQELYNKLQEEFPPTEEITKVFTDHKKFINSRDIEDYREDFFAERPHWKAVIEILESQEFASDVEKMLRPHLFHHRYLGALRKWCAYPDPANPWPFKRRTQIGYEWSAMPPGSLVNPHTDKCSKMATFVWHIPERNWKPEFRGATHFVTPKNAKYNANWSNFKLPFDEVEPLHISDAKQNRLIMFAKTANSWHAVPPIECPEGVWRRVFIFNIGMPFEDRSSFTQRAFESYYRRTEGWRYKDFPEINHKPGM